MITQETIARVRDKASLIEVIGESVSLKRQGRNFVGLCPFHAEKSPSFMVRDSGDSYYCFGCGASGNIVSYVMQTRGLSFPEAIEDLASRYGVEVVYEQSGQNIVRTQGHSELIYKINSLAQKFFEAELQKPNQILKSYVESRSLAGDTAKAFGVGYAPEQGGLVEFLRSRKIDDESIILAGIAQRNQSGRVLDRFRARLIFPIFIDTKRIAGFGGRILPGILEAEREKRSPKYLNSPETEVYKKSKILYGLPQASRKIRETGVVYLVEGYVDVIGLWRVGVENVVATCGTAVTPEHIKKLSYLSKRLVVLFDGDDAGRAAAAKMFPTTINSGLDAFAIFLSEEEDPDTFAEKHGTKTAEALQEKPQMLLFECYLDSLIDQYGGESGRSLGAAAKGKIAAELQKVLAKVENSIERSALLEIAASKLKIEAREFEQFISATGQIKDEPKKILTEPDAPHRQLVSSLPRVDQELLTAVIAQRSLIDEALRCPVICGQANSLTIQFLSSISAIICSDEDETKKKQVVKGFLQSLGEDWTELWRTAYKLAADKRSDPAKAYKECIKSYKKSQLKEQVKVAELELQYSQNDDEKVQLGQKMLKLTRRLADFSA